MSRYGWIRRSLMKAQMMRVISSPSSSTTGPATLIFAMGLRSPVGTGSAWLQVRDVGLLGPHGLGGFAEGSTLRLRQVRLDDPPDTLAPDLGLDTQVNAGDAVLAVDPGAHRQDGPGVLDHRAGHPSGCGGRRVVRRAGLEQCHDLGTTVAGAGDQLLDLLLGEQFGQRLAVGRASARAPEPPFSLRGPRPAAPAADREAELLGDVVG